MNQDYGQRKALIAIDSIRQYYGKLHELPILFRPHDLLIIHVDMDAFYASVEIRDNPDLADKPIVVGGSPTGRGVVAAASYEARRFGVHSAMPASQVLRRCPNAIFIKPRMEHYAAASRKIREIFQRYTSLVEPLSLDEAFLDVSGCEKLFGTAEIIAMRIKHDINSELHLVASAGVAPNKYLAKVASDLDKPDGFVVVDEAKILEFLQPLSIKRVWGVGKKCAAKFESIGVRTIGDLHHFSVKQLQPIFGGNAQHFWNLARGIDERLVVSDRVAKSISHETTFSHDVTNREVLAAWSIELMGQVGRRLRRHETKGRTIQIKLRYSDFHTITRAVTLAEPTNISKSLIDAAHELIVKELSPIHAPIRLLGVGVNNLTRRAMTQQTLFEQDDHKKHSKIDKVTDSILSKFGNAAVRSAKTIEQNVRHERDPNIRDGD